MLNSQEYNYKPMFKILIDQNMTRKELSARSGVSSSAITRMRNGRPVSITVLDSIASVLNCKVTDLYTKG